MRLLLTTLLLMIPFGLVSAEDKAVIVSLNPTKQQPPPPPPVGEALKVSPGKLQILKLDNYTGPAVTWQILQPLDSKDAEVAIVEWVVLPKSAPIFGYLEGETKARKHQFDTETVVVLATGAGNGKVRVRALVCDGGVVKVVAEIIVQVGEGGPTPQPPPPEPNPPTPVQPQKLFVVIIEESADAVIGRGVMLADVALSARMKEKGHRWRVVDKDVVGPDGQPPADIKRFLDASKSKTLPQLFLVNEKGETQVQQDLPKTPAELLTVIKKYGG